MAEERYIVEKTIDRRLVYIIIGASIVLALGVSTFFLLNVRSHKLTLLDRAVSVNDFDNAIYLFNELYRTNPLDKNIIKSGIALHYARMRYATNEDARYTSAEKAVSFVRQMMLIDWRLTRDPKAYAILGRAYEFRGQTFFDDAIECYERAVALGDTSVDTRVRTGVLCYTQGRFGNAVTHWEYAFDRVREGKSEIRITDDVRYLLGHAYAGASNYGKAIDYFTGLAQSTIDASYTSYIHADLGLWCFRQGLYPESEYHFKTALSLDDKNPRTYYNMAFLYKKMNRIGDARRALERSLWIDKKFLEAEIALKRL
ncbi:MAG: tetratricopeptide repeat protein [Spirochaetota bacterium]